MYVVKEWNSSKKKTKTLHRNLLKRVNELAPVLVSQPAPVAAGSHVDVSVTPPTATVSSHGQSKSRSLQNVAHKSELPTCASQQHTQVGRNIPQKHINPARVVLEPAQKHTRVRGHTAQKHNQKHVTACSVENSDSDSDSDDTIVVARKPRLVNNRLRLLTPLLRERESALLVENDVTLTQVSDDESGEQEDPLPAESEVDEEVEEVIEEETVSEDEETVYEGETDDARDSELNESFYSVISGSSIDTLNHNVPPQIQINDDPSQIQDNDDLPLQIQDNDDLPPQNLDDSLDNYPDIEDPPPPALRRSRRETRAPKGLDYDSMGNPVWKSRERVKKARKAKK